MAHTYNQRLPLLQQQPSSVLMSKVCIVDVVDCFVHDFALSSMLFAARSNMPHLALHCYHHTLVICILLALTLSLTKPVKHILLQQIRNCYIPASRHRFSVFKEPVSLPLASKTPCCCFRQDGHSSVLFPASMACPHACCCQQA